MTGTDRLTIRKGDLWTYEGTAARMRFFVWDGWPDRHGFPIELRPMGCNDITDHRRMPLAELLSEWRCVEPNPKGSLVWTGEAINA